MAAAAQVETLGLDPAFWTHARLPIGCLLGLAPHPRYKELFTFRGRAVARAEVVGYVVFADRKTGRMLYRIDDGTGLLACVQWLREDVDRADADAECGQAIGTLVSVRGRLSVFRATLQLSISHIAPLADVNLEPLFWLLTAELLGRPVAEFDLAASDGEANGGAGPGPGASVTAPAAARTASGVGRALRVSDALVAFRDLVLARLAVTPSYEALARAADLHAAATRALDADPVGASLPHETRFAHALRWVLDWLCRDGLVCLVAEPTGDVYVPVDGRSRLAEFVLGLAGDARYHDWKEPASQLTGVSASAVAALVWGSSEFAALPRAAIARVLDVLAVESRIYEIRPKVYRLL